MTNAKPMIVCVVCAETKPRCSRGMCANCYARLWKAKALPPKTSAAIPCVCQGCGVTMLIKPSHVARGFGRYCSRACMSAHTSAIAVPCIGCGKEFKVKPSHMDRNLRYCSRTCKIATNVKPAAPPKERPQPVRISKPCEYCGETMALPPSDTDQRFCSIRCRQKGSAVPKVSSACKGCGKAMESYPDRMRAFCSKACHLSSYPPSQQAERDSAAVRTWRAKVLRRDGHTCQHCGAQDKPLETHHIQHWATHPALRTVLANGIALCEACHDAVHYSHAA